MVQIVVPTWGHFLLGAFLREGFSILGCFWRAVLAALAGF